MASNEFSGIQTLVDNYIAGINKKYPGIGIGIVIGAVTPATPAGGLIFSTGQISTQGGQTITPVGTTPFEVGSVSKVFTTGIYFMRQITPNFEGTLGQRLGSQMTMSDTVKNIPIQCLASYASGFPQDNGHCTGHPNTGYPAGVAATLPSLFGFLGSYNDLPNPPGTIYTYSNLAMSLVSMAALNLDSLDTEAFGTAFNNALIQYCQTFGVDTGSTPTTQVYSQVDTGPLPVGYDSSYQEKNAPPCSIVEYGSGGVVSTGADMLKFLLYCMSTTYPAFMQQYRWQHTSYCSGNQGPATGYGWFLGSQTVKNQSIQTVAKDGAVAGFTAWIELEQRASPSSACPRGVFVLTNGPDAVTLGRQAFAMLIPPASSPAETEVQIPSELSVDARVH